MDYVYVVKLSDDVLKHKKFRSKNPNYVVGMDCLYVGMTGLEPEERFENHKKGHKAAKFVKNYGVRLMPELYEKYNPMEREKAKSKEGELAQSLRKQGYGVWQN
jgi:predicted GIY-YIG superfamily endonuclease